MEHDVFERERAHFPALEKWVYLDHATFGLIPDYALEDMKEYLTFRMNEGVNITRFWNMWQDADDFRSVLGQMLGCDGSEIVYGQSSTQLFNIFSNGIHLEAGDNVVTTDSIYPADAYTILNKKSQGIELRMAKTSAEGITPEELMAYTDEHTKAVILCMVENRTGWRHDIKRVAQLCHEKGILIAVDATQCANTMRIDVKDMGIDFLTTSLYKWMMGAQGHGFGYISKELLPNLKQSVCGWVGSVDRTNNSAERLQLSSDAKRFELGGISFPAQIGMKKVVEHYLALDPEKIEKHILSLIQHVYDRSDELEKLKLIAKFPEQNRSAITIFQIPNGMVVTDEMLAERGIRARVMHGKTIRAGFHYINNLQDVDCLIDALKDIEKSV